MIKGISPQIGEMELDVEDGASKAIIFTDGDVIIEDGHMDVLTDVDSLKKIIVEYERLKKESGK